jgi:peptide deformylase
MTLRKIARLGHPILLAPALPVADPERPDVQALVDDMLQTMRDADGIGLAAPQVHVPRRLCLIGVVEEAEEGEPQHLRILVAVNPVVTPLTDETIAGVEGCLSMEDLRGVVPRRRAVRLEALDRDGEPYALELEGYPAVVAQHETDHLDGVLFVDRLDTEARKAAMKAIRESEWFGLEQPAVKVSPHPTRGLAI